MTSYRTKSTGLSPKERSRTLAAAKSAVVIKEGARAEEEKVWDDVRDETARGSDNGQSEGICQPCGENVTTEPAEEAPVRIAKDPRGPTEEEFENHCATHLPSRR